MGGTSLERSNFARSAIVWLVTFAALVLLVSVLSYWTWVWFAPRPASRVRGAEVQPRVEAAYGLFGGAQRSRNAATPTGLAIRLMGVAAATGGKSGYAVVQLDSNRILAAREGADIAPGIRLVEVQGGQIILERNGAREALALPERNSPARTTGVVRQQNTPAISPVRNSRD